jgi:hypothetical protein
MCYRHNLAGLEGWPRVRWAQRIIVMGSDTSCGRTNLNYTGSSTRVLSLKGSNCTSNGIIPWPVG